MTTMIGCMSHLGAGAKSGPTKGQSFHAAMNEETITELSKKRFASNSEKKICWVTGLYSQWHQHWINQLHCPISILRSDLRFPMKLEKGYFAQSVSRFLTKIRKLNRSEYLPQTLYQMVVCLQMFLETEKLYWHLFDKSDSNLADLYYTLDNLMKLHTEEGLGHKQSAEIIPTSVENVMWESGVLGQDQPRQLLDAVIYLLGVNLALRGGIEHKNLQHPGFNPQITVSKDPVGHKCLLFREDPKTKMN